MSECAVEAVTTVTLSRGEAEPLVIPETCGPEGFWFSAVTLPDFRMRYSYAPPSAYVPGQMLLGAIPDASSVAVLIHARAETTAALLALQVILSEALAQWTYTVSVTVTDSGGPVVIGSYAARPTNAPWGDVIKGQVEERTSTTRVSIPVNPPGAP